MRNLRAHYGKECGKVKASKITGTGANDVYTPAWKWYYLLVFLYGSINPVKTKATPGVPSPSMTQTIDDDDRTSIIFRG